MRKVVSMAWHHHLVVMGFFPEHWRRLPTECSRCLCFNELAIAFKECWERLKIVVVKTCSLYLWQNTLSSFRTIRYRKAFLYSVCSYVVCVYVFADGFLRILFFRKTCCSLIEISALVQAMALGWTGDKPLPEPMMTHFTDICLCHLAATYARSQISRV